MDVIKMVSEKVLTWLLLFKLTSRKWSETIYQHVLLLVKFNRLECKSIPAGCIQSIHCNVLHTLLCPTYTVMSHAWSLHFDTAWALNKRRSRHQTAPVKVCHVPTAIHVCANLKIIYVFQATNNNRHTPVSVQLITGEVSVVKRVGYTVRIC